MKNCYAPLFGLALAVGIILPASATVAIDYVTVGNAGNEADTTGFGAVAYDYQIGKYEVTNAQYAEFLNAVAATDDYGLYNSGMAGYGIIQSGSSGSYTYTVTNALADRPVVLVSWFDAARFSNWLSNGQGNGSTETGAYNLAGATSGVIIVNPSANVWIPSENEWYKAAYYNGNSGTYSLYPNGQSSMDKTQANYSNGFSSDVGSFAGSPSSYGTFDQGGNALEWNDGVIGSTRVLRGAGWDYPFVEGMSSASRFSYDPTVESIGIGFRVAAVPEPSAWMLSVLAGGMLLIRRKR